MKYEWTVKKKLVVTKDDIKTLVEDAEERLEMYSSQYKDIDEAIDCAVYDNYVELLEDGVPAHVQEDIAKHVHVEYEKKRRKALRSMRGV